MVLSGTIVQRHFSWQPAYRIVPTRYPSIYLFDRVADAADFDALYALEAMTNERVRDEIGQIDLVAKEDRIFGEGSGPIMAAFTHINQQGSRFANGQFGMFYAAKEKTTAMAETQYHHGLFMAATAQPTTYLSMRLYQVTIEARLHDLRGKSIDQSIYQSDSYAASQALGQHLRELGSRGVVYHSVRRSTGQCVGLFKPNGARQCLHAAYLLYHWNGTHFDGVYEKVA